MSDAVLNERRLEALRQIAQGAALTILDVAEEKSPEMANALLDAAFAKIYRIMREAEHVDSDGVKNVVRGPHILSYNVLDGIGVTVAAKQVEEKVWNITGAVNGQTRIMATTFCGRWATSTICKFLRNGLYARAMHQRRKNANRAARKAAADEQSQSVQ